MNVHYQEQADRDIDNALAWYEKQQSGLGSRFYAALICAEAGVMMDPLLGREVEPGWRKWNLQRFPFALLYRVTGDEIHVHTVMDLRRKPGYWKRP